MRPGVGRFESRRDVAPAKTRDDVRARGLAEALRLGAVIEQAADRRGDRGGVLLRDEPAGPAVVNGLRQPARSR